MDSRHRSLTTRVTAVGKVAIALALMAGAAELTRLHLTVGMQRINLRYVPEASDADRLAVEQQFGLVSGIERESRTWSYTFPERSSNRIRALVSSPLVEDTHGIDRSSFRVALDRPDLPAMLRALAERGWLPWISSLLALWGAASLWGSRHAVLDGFRHAAALLPSLTAPARHDGGAPLSWLGVIAGLTAVVLALALPWQLFDTNFYSLWEATSLLAGEHPYRDFYEWGVPLQALLSALVQWMVGYRLVGEFLIIHWSFISGPLRPVPHPCPC